jgi:hypothetical protein
MRKLILLLALFFVAACASLQTYPYSACLYDSANRYDRGRVLAKRDSDDALFFEYADPSKGDKGFQWVKPGDPRTVRRCREATLMDAAADHSRRDREPEREKEP